jgi:hypothetical protein
MNRRHFLQHTALGLSAGFLALPAYAEGPYAPLLDGIAAPETARRIGAAMLRQGVFGQTDDVLRAIAEKLDPLVSGGAARHCKSVIADQIREDFDRNDCVKVDGWVLSKTEAALFALAALHA